MASGLFSRAWIPAIAGTAFAVLGIPFFWWLASSQLVS